MIFFRIVRYTVIGAAIGALTPVALWIAISLIQRGTGPTADMLRRAWAAVRARGPADLYVHTGAIVGGVLAACLSAYVGPIVGGYALLVMPWFDWFMWLITPGDIGAAIFGLACGVAGYFMRIKRDGVE